MTDSFQLVWEALHPDADQFGGGLVDAPVGQGFLFYPGDVRRTGVLMWQKNKVAAPAEVQCVRYGTDEIVWSKSIGGDLDVSSAYAHELRQILQIRPLMLTRTVVLCAINQGSERWLLNALSRTDGTLLWSTVAQEPSPEAGIESADLFVVARADGAVDLLRIASGQTVKTLMRVADNVNVQTGPAGIAVVDDAGMLHFFDRDGQKRFQVPLTLGELDSAENRVRVRGEDLILCDAGKLRSLNAQTGQVRWTTDTVGEGQVALFETRSYIIVQSLAPSGVMLHRADTGAKVMSDAVGSLRHWVEMDGDIVGPDQNGNVVVVDPVVGLVRHTFAVDGLTAFEVAVSDRRLFMTAVRTQEEPLVLLELDPVTGQVLRQVDLPGPGVFHLDSPTSGSVVVTCASGIAVYNG